MRKLNVRKKGAIGEIECCDWIKRNLQLPKNVKIERNLTQTRDGGCDIICAPFAFEVKRCEVLQLNAWWKQARDNAFSLNLEPVLAFRQNQKKWNFCISARFIAEIDAEKSTLFLQLDEKTFIFWANEFLSYVEI